jgi:hypothetical protein
VTSPVARARNAGHPDRSTVGPVPPHAASVRPQPTSFERSDNGWCVTYFGDPTLWEVVCPGCGDDLTAAVMQPETARALRGPFPSHDEALAAAAAHDDRFGLSNR